MKKSTYTLLYPFIYSHFLCVELPHTQCQTLKALVYNFQPTEASEAVSNISYFGYITARLGEAKMRLSLIPSLSYLKKRTDLVGDPLLDSTQLEA